MKLFKHYRNAVIYPAIFIIFFNLVYSLLYNYESNGLAVNSDFLTSFIPSLIFALLMCVLALTIFLNKIYTINKNLISNILTWFLLPFLYLSMIFFHELIIRVKFEFGFGNDFLYLLILTIPFVIGLILTFTKYRQQITTDETA